MTHRIFFAVCLIAAFATACSAPIVETPDAAEQAVETQSTPQSPALADTSEAQVDLPVVEFLAFGEPAATALDGDAFDIWATNYYTPVYETQASGIPLIDKDNREISGKLSREQWCNVALQGAAALKEPDGSVTAFVFADQSGPEQTNCDDRLGNLSDSIKRATRRVRFSAVQHPYGCGVRNWPLIPYRTIAVDKDTIPYQTTLYIETLAGKTFELNGQTYTHDGFVFAADKGGAIKGNHIDFFSGNSRRVPFTDVVTSNENRTVSARFVSSDSGVARQLKALHSKSCSG